MPDVGRKWYHRGLNELRLEHKILEAGHGNSHGVNVCISEEEEQNGFEHGVHSLEDLAAGALTGLCGMLFEELSAVVEDLLQPLQQLNGVACLATEKLHGYGVRYLGKERTRRMSKNLIQLLMH